MAFSPCYGVGLLPKGKKKALIGKKLWSDIMGIVFFTKKIICLAAGWGAWIGGREELARLD